MYGRPPSLIFRTDRRAAIATVCGPRVPTHAAGKTASPSPVQTPRGIGFLTLPLTGKMVDSAEDRLVVNYARHLVKAVLVFVFAIFVFGAARGADLKGIPAITDADTVVISGTSIRLDGIDAPESDQICLDKNGDKWSCGIAARDALVKQFGSIEWTCRTTGQETYNRLLATCFVGAENINQWLVRSGWAMSFLRYSHRYDPDEEVARRACIGLWMGSFHAPWDWRRRSCQTEIRGCLMLPINAQDQLCGPRSIPPDPKCTIKATVRSSECVYHLEVRSLLWCAHHVREQQAVVLHRGRSPSGRMSSS
jgi:endonuclease YncB( thermonuclease family)